MKNLIRYLKFQWRLEIDKLGRQVNYRNTIFIKTSNFGMKDLKDFEVDIDFDTKYEFDNNRWYYKKIKFNTHLKKAISLKIINRLGG